MDDLIIVLVTVGVKRGVLVNVCVSVVSVVGTMVIFSIFFNSICFNVNVWSFIVLYCVYT